MVEIRTQLREAGITKQEFANCLKLSRPTLDAYIDMYENGKIIPKERYQIAFDLLFGGDKRNSGDFMNELSSLQILLERDERLGIDKLEPLASDKVFEIFSIMVSDINDETGWSGEVYGFIEYLLKNYKKKEKLLKFIEYFYYFYIDLTEIDISHDRIDYFVKFYKMSKYFKGTIEKYQPEDLEKLKNEKKIKKLKTEQKAQKSVEEITERLQEVAIEIIKEGIEPSKEEILNRIIEDE